MKAQKESKNPARTKSNKEKAKNLIDLKGKVKLAETLEEFLEKRRKDIPPNRLR